jgi:hypothetical protein
MLQRCSRNPCTLHLQSCEGALLHGQANALLFLSILLLLDSLFGGLGRLEKGLFEGMEVWNTKILLQLRAVQAGEGGESEFFGNQALSTWEVTRTKYNLSPLILALAAELAMVLIDFALHLVLHSVSKCRGRETSGEGGRNRETHALAAADALALCLCAQLARAWASIDHTKRLRSFKFS